MIQIDCLIEIHRFFRCVDGCSRVLCWRVFTGLITGNLCTVMVGRLLKKGDWRRQQSETHVTLKHHHTCLSACPLFNNLFAMPSKSMTFIVIGQNAGPDDSKTTEFENRLPIDNRMNEGEDFP
jgi:hypothetical protein